MKHDHEWYINTHLHKFTFKNDLQQRKLLEEKFSFLTKVTLCVTYILYMNMEFVS